MKKTLLLTALGLASASQLMAVDLYVTGSTAFRANVYTACTKVFDAAPAITYGDAAHGGDANNNSKTASWCMTGTVSNTITALGTTPLTIHGLFTGSVQGIQTVEQRTPLLYATPTSGVYVTNTPTIGFSDASGTSTPYPATGNFNEENVCVQPFVMVKSVVGGGLTNVNNVTWEQLRYGIAAGRIPLSTWSGKPADHSSYVYLVQRTKDSGTRRCELAQEQFGYNAPCTVYLYDAGLNAFYKPSGTVVVGPSGVFNANLNWGSGYVGGGDIAKELATNNIANQAISYLSIGDARTITGVNWSQVIPFNGLYPTAAGAGISGNTGTNDYTPIAEGMYPCWGYEVVVYPNVDPSSLSSDQNLMAAQFGTQSTTGTIMGVLNAQTLINGGSPLAGSIENEIELSKTAANGATAIRLSDMVSSRQAVGGTITP